MKIFVMTTLLLLARATYAQMDSPIGLFEGLMANSGAASRSSTAASFYNPSLLLQRFDNAFNMGGTSIGTLSSESKGTSLNSSLQISPAYLSSLLVGTDLVHEFFLANVLQGQFDFSSIQSDLQFKGKAQIQELISGYSLAFKSIPLALQVLGRYTEFKEYGVTEGTLSGVPGSYYVGRSEGEYKNLNLALGISTHLDFGGYSLGFNLNTRGLNIYSNKVSRIKTYTHGTPNPDDFTIKEKNQTNISASNIEGRLVIGHGFRIGVHEFLTDTIFYEESNNLDRYNLFQTFGYRYGLFESSQWLFGVSHELGPAVHYFGHNMKLTAGYSWLTRKLRSSVGLYFGKDETTASTQNYGVVVGSQYEY